MDVALHLMVQDLLARYVQAVDDDRLEAWPDFFVEDGRYRITTADNFRRDLPLSLIYATSRAMLRDRVRALRQANIYESQRYRHIIGAPVIEAGSDVGTGSRVHHVRAHTSFLVVRIMHGGETVIFASGVYADQIILDAGTGTARFSEKVVILDSRQIDTLLALPL